jgi:O-methyltransferase
VNRGGLSRAIIDFVDFPSRGKTFYLFDTFEGLVERYISEDEKRQGVVPGGYTECYEAVQKNFVGLPVQIIRGAVPETLNQVSIGKVAYLSIDMNCTAPEIAAAEFFWDKLVPGGFVLLDDYGWEGHIEQKKAFDEFARQRGTRVLCLPTGQGVLFKD